MAAFPNIHILALKYYDKQFKLCQQLKALECGIAIVLLAQMFLSLSLPRHPWWSVRSALFLKRFISDSVKLMKDEYQPYCCEKCTGAAQMLISPHGRSSPLIFHHKLLSHLDINMRSPPAAKLWHLRTTLQLAAVWDLIRWIDFLPTQIVDWSNLVHFDPEKHHITASWDFQP